MRRRGPVEVFAGRCRLLPDPELVEKVCKQSTCLPLNCVSKTCAPARQTSGTKRKKRARTSIRKRYDDLSKSSFMLHHRLVPPPDSHASFTTGTSDRSSAPTRMSLLSATIDGPGSSQCENQELLDVAEQRLCSTSPVDAYPIAEFV